MSTSNGTIASLLSSRFIRVIKFIKTLTISRIASFTWFSSNTSDIALIRLDKIGDFILWISAAKEIRNHFPNQKITLYSNASWSDLAKHFDYWNEVVSIDTQKFEKNWYYRFSTIRSIRKRNFKIAIHPTFSRTLDSDCLTWGTQAMQRIGSIGDYTNIPRWQKKITDHWYTRLVQAESFPMMELSRNIEFINHLFETKAAEKLPFIPKLPTKIEHPKPYYIIFPGAGAPERRWPTINFVNLACEIKALCNWNLVLCGGIEDDELCSEINNRLQGTAINLAGKTSLPDLIELIRNSSLIITNETSAVHIAAAVNTPSICILGGGHFNRFMPYNLGLPLLPTPVFKQMDCFGCNWQCHLERKKDSPFPCIRDVSVQSALKAFETINLILE